MICDRARGDREPWLRGLSMHPRHAKAEQKCGAKLCERRHLAVLSSGLLLATKAASAAGDNHLCGEGPSAQTAIALSSLPACSGTISQTPTAVATMKTGIVREARAKEPVACCSRDGGERPQHKSDEEADEPHDAIGDTPNAVARGWHRNRRFADSPLEGTGFEPSVPREAAGIPVIWILVRADFSGSQASDMSWRRKLGRVTRDRWFESGFRPFLGPGRPPVHRRARGRGEHLPAHGAGARPPVPRPRPPDRRKHGRGDRQRNLPGRSPGSAQARERDLPDPQDRRRLTLR